MFYRFTPFLGTAQYLYGRQRRASLRRTPMLRWIFLTLPPLLPLPPTLPLSMPSPTLDGVFTVATSSTNLVQKSFALPSTPRHPSSSSAFPLVSSACGRCPNLPRCILCRSPTRRSLVWQSLRRENGWHLGRPSLDSCWFGNGRVRVTSLNSKDITTT